MSASLCAPFASPLHLVVAYVANPLVCVYVCVLSRGDFVEGTVDNRRVTIAGTPNCAQTAHTLIVHKLRQALEEGYL